jgi:hypothetical protein
MIAHTRSSLVYWTVLITIGCVSTIVGVARAQIHPGGRICTSYTPDFTMSSTVCCSAAPNVFCCTEYLRDANGNIVGVRAYCCIRDGDVYREVPVIANDNCWPPQH